MKTTRDLIREAVGPAQLADYLTADAGWRLGVYPDGSVTVGEAVGMEIAAGDRPVVTAPCPGLGNLDLSWWQEGWDSEGLSAEECVLACCEHGDIEAELDDLRRRLYEAAEENGRWEAERAAQRGNRGGDATRGPGASGREEGR